MRAGRKFLFLPLAAAVMLCPTAFGSEAQETAAVSAVKTEEKMLIPGGQAIGITLESDGILVLGTGGVTGKDRRIYYPAQNVLREGDIILEADGVKLDDKEALAEAVKESGKSLELKVSRNDEVTEVSVSPVKCIEDGSSKIGVWVRDSTQGIGTLTFIDPSDGSFGALGHGVYDADTGKLMSVKSGSVVKSDITGVKKSEKGTPGEIMGVLDKTDVLGSISENTDIGIYGSMDGNIPTDFWGKAMPTAAAEDVKVGDAVILCSVDGGEKKAYSAKIESVDTKHADADKGLIIRITDERLKNTAGGIVQGMSGSPIIQDGKLVGAVTHVFVREPDKGYGIFIENMLGITE